MPVIGIIVGGLDLSNLSIKVGLATIKYGAFINNIINFWIIALCIFIMIKILSKLSRKKEEPKSLPVKSQEVLLLEEIRDELKKKSK